MAMGMGPQKYTLLVMGDTGVGKSAFLEKHVSGHFDKIHRFNLGVETSLVKLTTTRGVITFELKEVPGRYRHNVQSSHLAGGEAAILFFSLDCEKSYKNVRKWRRIIKEKLGNIPMVLVQAKCDLSTLDVKMKQNKIDFHLEKGMKYFKVSSKTNANLTKPLLSLARELFILREPEWEVVYEFGPPPIPLNVTAGELQNISAALLEAEAVNLPDDDELDEESQ